MKPTVYIAGKITGEPFASTFLKFNEAQKQFTDLGINSINPMKLGLPRSWSFDQCRDICFSVIGKCTDLYLLPDYNKSPGAMQELEYAISTGITIHYPVDNIKNHFRSHFKLSQN